MTHKAKFKRTLKIIGVVLLVIIVIAGILVGLDYKTYKDGNRSDLFGTLDNYTQAQTLKFGNLDLHVVSVSVKLYPKPVASPEIATCMQQITISPGGFQGDTCSKNVTTSALEQTYYQKLDLYQNNKSSLTVNFVYDNAGSQPVDLSGYKANLIANTSLDTNFDNDHYPDKSSCGGLSNKPLLNGSKVQSCFNFDIDKNYKGPLALVVSSGGTQKVINLKINQG